MRNQINWNETELVNWIGTNKRPIFSKSRQTYKQAFEAYYEFTGLSAKKLIDEAEAKKKEQERQEALKRAREAISTENL